MLAFHGTTQEAATKIRREGFKPGTYFALKQEDAKKFGGPCIFTVEFSDDPGMWHGESDGWQFHTNVHIPTGQIISG